MTLIRTSKFVLLTGLALAAFLFGPARLEAQTSNSIGVFNLQTAINDSKRGQSVKNELESKYTKMDKELKDKEAALEKKSKELQTQSSTLNREALNKRQSALMAEAQEFRGKVQSYTEEMQKAEAEALRPLFDEAFQIAEELGKQKGFVMVIEAQKAGVVYCLDSMDLTVDVVKALDAKKKK